MNANPAAPNPGTPELTMPGPGIAIVFAGRFTLIAAGLIALIARAFLRHPGLAPLILPLCGRLTRTARRLATIMARLPTAQPVQRSRPGRTGGRAAKYPIPTSRAWLIRTLRHDAAAYASQLSHLLAEPGVSELLDAAPAARRLLNPLCRMLGIPDTALRAVARQATSDTALRAVARQATGVFRLKNPESGVAPLPRPPLCPRLRLRWPWYTKPDPKPA